jgi:hypothetical protein
MKAFAAIVPNNSTLLWRVSYITAKHKMAAARKELISIFVLLVC